MIHLAVVVFIVIAGLSQANGTNMTQGGFAPYGARGVWNGAALVFFSYIGFDAVATTAEEVRTASSLTHVSVLESRRTLGQRSQPSQHES